MLLGAIEREKKIKSGGSIPKVGSLLTRLLEDKNIMVRGAAIQSLEILTRCCEKDNTFAKEAKDIFGNGMPSWSEKKSQIARYLSPLLKILFQRTTGWSDALIGALNEC